MLACSPTYKLGLIHSFAVRLPCRLLPGPTKTYSVTPWVGLPRLGVRDQLEFPPLNQGQLFDECEIVPGHIAQYGDRLQLRSTKALLSGSTICTATSDGSAEAPSRGSGLTTSAVRMLSI
jgi:hypothetical protein